MACSLLFLNTCAQTLCLGEPCREGDTGKGGQARPHSGLQDHRVLQDPHHCQGKCQDVHGISGGPQGQVPPGS